MRWLRQRWQQAPARRWVWSVAAATAVALAWAACGGSGSTESSPAAALAERLAGAGDPARYAFDYRASGTQVLDCMLPNREFSGVVDLDAGVMALRTATDPGRDAVVVGDDEALLRSTLFAAGSVPAAWLSIGQDEDLERLAELRRAVGVDLGGYAVPGGYAPSGNAMARAALDITAAVGVLDSGQGGPAGADGFRIVIDPERYEEAAPLPSTSTTRPGADPAPVPEVDVWVDADGMVVRVVVRPSGTGPGGAEAADTSGWVVDYRYDVAAPSPPSIEPGDVTPLGELESLALAPVGDCELAP